MFEFETIERPSMNLNKHWEDYVTLYEHKPNPVLLSKTERFRQNTSGRKTGHRERIERGITELASLPSIDKKRYDESTIHQKLMDKIDSIADFNVNQMGLTDIWHGFKNYVWKNVVNEITTDTYKRNKDSAEIRFFDEMDKEGSGEDENVLSVSDILYHRGDLPDVYEEVEYDLNQVKKDIIEVLEVCNRYNKSKFITTKDKTEVNCLRLPQHAEAFLRLSTEKEQLSNIRGSVEKSHLKTVTSSKKNSGSLGLGNKNYFNRTIETILHSDLLGKRELVKTFIKFYKALDYLNVDIIWVDVDQIVQDDYILKLKSLLYDNSVVFVSQEELDLLESNFTFEDYKINEVRNLVSNNKKVNKRDVIELFDTKTIKRIKSIKASELRKISEISKEMVNDYVEMIDKTPELGLPETVKRETALRTHTAEYLQRAREIETTILTRGHYIEGEKETKTIPGILSNECKLIIKNSIDEYFDDLLKNDPVKFREIAIAIAKKYLGTHTFEGKEYKLEEDIEGYYFFKYTDEKGATYRRYVQERVKPFKMRSNDSSVKVEVDKWLVNSKGFLVFKSVDGYLRQGRENVKLWHGSVKEGPTIVIKDILGNTIPTIYN